MNVKVSSKITKKTKQNKQKQMYPGGGFPFSNKTFFLAYYHYLAFQSLDSEQRRFSERT